MHEEDNSIETSGFGIHMARAIGAWELKTGGDLLTVCITTNSSQQMNKPSGMIVHRGWGGIQYVAYMLRISECKLDDISDDGDEHPKRICTDGTSGNCCGI